MRVCRRGRHGPEGGGLVSPACSSGLLLSSCIEHLGTAFSDMPTEPSSFPRVSLNFCVFCFPPRVFSLLMFT